jgi:hypothetical protein
MTVSYYIIDDNLLLRAEIYNMYSYSYKLLNLEKFTRTALFTTLARLHRHQFIEPIDYTDYKIIQDITDYEFSMTYTHKLGC